MSRIAVSGLSMGMSSTVLEETAGYLRISTASIKKSFINAIGLEIEFLI